MIKQSEVQEAYLTGRRAAMSKLADDKSMAGTEAIMNELAKQREVAKLVGLTSHGLLDDAGSLQTRENAARLAMLAGTAGGTYLGGEGARSAALSSGGSMLGALVGGNLGRAAHSGVNAYIGENRSSDQMKNPRDREDYIATGGMLGALGGGLGAGKYLS